MIGNSIASLHGNPSGASPILTNLHRWYDASVSSSITSASNLVSQWNDLSGNGGHLTQATGALQPTTNTTTQNGLNVLVSTADVMNATVSITSNAFTFFIVANKTGAGTASNVYTRLMSLRITTNNDFNNTDGATLIYSPDAGIFGTANKVGTYRNSASPTSIAGIYNQSNIHVFRLDGANVKQWFNATTATGTTSATPMNSNQLGMFGAAATGGVDGFLNGNIAEVLLYNAVLSDTDVATNNAYLKTKWGTP